MDSIKNFSSNGLLLERSDGLAVLTLNRPDKLNALSIQMRADLDQVLPLVLNDDAVKVVLIQANGQAFCGGADLDDLPSDPLAWRKRIQLAQRHHRALIDSDKIVIAAVQGSAAGGGASLALAADILVLADDARLMFPFVHLGIVPDGGCSFLLQQKLGPALALDLMLTGGNLDATEAQRYGLTRRVVSPDVLHEEARKLARTLLRTPTEALMLTKSITRQVWARAMGEVMAYEADAFALATTRPAHHVALDAARAQRRPSKQGLLNVYISSVPTFFRGERADRARNPGLNPAMVA